MASIRVGRERNHPNVLAALVAVVVAMIAISITTLAFFFAAESARRASGDVVVPVTIFGLPLFQGFRHDGFLGVHAQWGAAVMLVTFLGAAVALSVAVGARKLRGRSS